VKKCALLAAASGKDVLLVSGEPWAEEARNHYDITLFVPRVFENSSGWEFGEGRRCSEEIWLINECSAHSLKTVPHARDDKFPLSGTWARAARAA
jgi:hypothetical protein